MILIQPSHTQSSFPADMIDTSMHSFHPLDSSLTPPPQQSLIPLQLGLGLGLLQHGVELRSLHDVALDLELSSHEETLGVGLASDELAKVLVREVKCDCCENCQVSASYHVEVNSKQQQHTIGLRAQTSADLARLLEVNVPALRLAARILQRKGIHAVALLDGILAVGVAGVESLVDGVKGDRGGELV